MSMRSSSLLSLARSMSSCFSKLACKFCKEKKKNSCLTLHPPCAGLGAKNFRSGDFFPTSISAVPLPYNSC